jgi:UDP-N-acetyl-D-mannosaminuronate dehydrogenase
LPRSSVGFVSKPDSNEISDGGSSVSDEVVLVVGLGEVGGPLFKILSRTYQCIGVDIDPVEISRTCSVLHLCIPYQIKDFTRTSCEYIAKYKPECTVVNSTVAPGTTEAIAERSGTHVAYSPVRGKHAKMEADMLRYRKFVGAQDPKVLDAVIQHFAGAGFKTDRFRTPRIGEVSKLLETTWLGMLVSWAQEIERVAENYGATYDEVNAYIEEIDFLPHVFPGVIGGHCIMPNIEILRDALQSDFLDVIVSGNQQKIKDMKLRAERMRA